MMIDITEFVEQAKELGLLGVKITIDGKPDAEWFLEEDCRRNIYSGTKSFTALAVGFALQEGLLSLDEKLTDAFAGDIPAEPDENLKAATVRDLLTMCLGQEKGTLMGASRVTLPEDDWVKYSLSIPFVHQPGTKFVYNNVGPYLAGILVQRRAGCDLTHYLMPRLFNKLGIKRPTWECDPLGNSFGAGGLFLALSEFHKVGEFLMNDGVIDGKQVLSREWIRECTKAQDVPHYGYLFWMGSHGSYRMDGKYCQLSIGVREKHAVISMLAECRQPRELMTAIDQLLDRL